MFPSLISLVGVFLKIRFFVFSLYHCFDVVPRGLKLGAAVLFSVRVSYPLSLNHFSCASLFRLTHSNRSAAAGRKLDHLPAVYRARLGDGDVGSEVSAK